MANGFKTINLLLYVLQQRQEVPQNFKRALSSRLRRLVQQDKLEKVILYFVALVGFLLIYGVLGFKIYA